MKIKENIDLTKYGFEQWGDIYLHKDLMAKNKDLETRLSVNEKKELSIYASVESYSGDFYFNELLPLNLELILKMAADSCFEETKEESKLLYVLAKGEEKNYESR